MIRWWERRTLRFRLALWYAFGGTVLLAAFSATTYLYVSHWIARPLDQELRQDLLIIRERLTITPDGLVRWDGADIPDHSSWPVENPWFELWDENNQLIKRVWPFTDNRVQVMPTAPVPKRETISIFNVAKDLKLRVLSVPYPVPGRNASWTIRVMQFHEPVTDALHALQLIIFFSLPVVVALLVIGGYILTRRWLSPLDAMVAEANRITAENIDRRLPVSNPHDELGRLASVFNVTLDRLARSFDALNRFVADASHELRTPLTTLRSVGEIGLKRSRSVEEYRDIIGSMLEETQRLQLLVQRLLELASTEGGLAELQCSQINIDELVVTCVSETSILAETKSQQLLVDAKPISAFTDPLLLRQALQNLLDNAIKYSPEGALIRVSIKTTTDSMLISVEDNGPGIGEEHRAYLAERFYRPDRGRDRGRGGFGLGLSLTKAYINMLGGKLEFTPVYPHGSIFTLHLPSARLHPEV